MQQAARDARTKPRKFEEWQSGNEGFKAKLEEIVKGSVFRAKMMAFGESFDVYSEGKEVTKPLEKIFENRIGTEFYLSSVKLIEKEKNEGVWGITVDFGSEVTPVEISEGEEQFWFISNLREVNKLRRKVNDGEYSKEEFAKERFVCHASFSEIETEPRKVLAYSCYDGIWKEWLDQHECEDCEEDLSDHQVRMKIEIELQDPFDDNLDCFMEGKEAEKVIGCSLRGLLEFLCDHDDNPRKEEFAEQLEEVMELDDFPIRLRMDPSSEFADMMVEEFMM